MSSLRSSSILEEQESFSSIIYCPKLYDTGFKRRIISGRTLALFASLQKNKLNPLMLDCNYKAIEQPDLSQYLEEHDAQGKEVTVLVFLAKTDAYGNTLLRIADELVSIRNKYPALKLLGYGYLAAAASDELMAYGALDGVILQDKLVTIASNMSGTISMIAGIVQNHINSFISLKNTHFPADYITTFKNSIVTIDGSFGCNSKCTFCAYNKDIGKGWINRSMLDAASDIKYLYETYGATRFAFSDNDFGGTPYECLSRSRDLRQILHPISDKITIALNIRSEVLDEASIVNFAHSGVKTFLMGVESFHEKNLKKIFGKRVDRQHLENVVKWCDDNKINVVASYILWHPWQTIEDIKFELGEIIKFGRYRIPQFMRNSILHIMPKTPMEQIAEKHGFLEKRFFHRSFSFKDANVKKLYETLNSWYVNNVKSVLQSSNEDNRDDIRKISKLKIDEFEWLQNEIYNY